MQSPYSTSHTLRVTILLAFSTLRIPMPPTLAGIHRILRHRSLAFHLQARTHQSEMAERPQPHQVQVHPRYEGGFKGPQRRGPSASKVLAVITMLPVGGGFLALSGITLVGTLIGLAVITPLFIICSPVLVPAALLLGFSVTAFLASGAFGLTGLTSLSWVVEFLRQAGQAMPEQLDQAKKRMQDMAGYVGQEIQRKAYEGK